MKHEKVHSIYKKLVALDEVEPTLVSVEKIEIKSQNSCVRGTATLYDYNKYNFMPHEAYIHPHSLVQGELF